MPDDHPSCPCTAAPPLAAVADTDFRALNDAQFRFRDRMLIHVVDQWASAICNTSTYGPDPVYPNLRGLSKEDDARAFWRFIELAEWLE